MKVEDDEILKAGCHGILLGATLPVLLYNLGAKNKLNACIYTILVGFESFQILKHLARVKDGPSNPL